MKKIKYIGFIYILTHVLTVNLSHAENQCVQGSADKMLLLDQLKMAQNMNVVTRSICEKYGLMNRTEASSVEDCPLCSREASLAAKNVADLKIAGTPPRKMVFKLECLNAAGSIQASAQEVSCPDGKKGKFNYCISPDLLNYENAVVSEFLSCVKKLKQEFPMTGEGLFEMYSLESGFKPNYASTGGTGLGQLTSVFVEDTLRQGRGRTVMDLVAKSSEPECENAKKIAEKDLNDINDKDARAYLKKNPCAFTQVGEGVERNILYSMVEMANNWERDVAPSMKKFTEKWSKHPKFNSDPQFKEDFGRAQQLALINSYGHGGLVAARTTARSLSHNAPNDFIKKIQKPLYLSDDSESLTDYITTMKSRQMQLREKMSEPLKSEFVKSGAKACAQ